MKFDGTENTRSVWLKRAFFTALAIASMTLTAIFFLNHLFFPAIWNLDRFLHSVFVVALGLISADVGVLIWREIKQKVCESDEQRAVADGMIALTLAMAALTTLGGIAEAFAGASLLPEAMNNIIGWAVVIALALQFIFGAFMFDLFSPSGKIQKAITDAIVRDAGEMVNEIALRMEQNREQRVNAVSAEIARKTDTAILNRFMPNDRTLKKPAPAPPPRAYRVEDPTPAALPTASLDAPRQEVTVNLPTAAPEVAEPADQFRGTSPVSVAADDPLAWFQQLTPAQQRALASGQRISESGVPYDATAIWHDDA